jgi:Family of unknown function (DUF5304)
MTDGARSSADHPLHGSIGEEAVKLAEAVQEWLGDRTGRGASDAWAAATAPGAFESPECRVCPVCRAMHFVSSMQPDVFAHLADAAASLSAAVRAMGEANAGERPEPAGPVAEATGVDDQPSGEA